MTKQIWGNTHVLDFHYVVSGVTHRMRCYVNAIPSGDSTGYDLENVAGGTTPLSTAVTQWAPLFSAALGTGTTAGGYTLSTFDGSIATPIYTGTWTLGTTSGTPQIGWEVTWFFRGGSNFPLKVVLLEANYASLQHSTSDASADIGVAAHNLSVDIKNTASGHLGAWMHTFNGHYGFRFIAETVAPNRRLRKRRGLT
jgi:hypothetical protein